MSWVDYDCDAPVLSEGVAYMPGLGPVTDDDRNIAARCSLQGNGQHVTVGINRHPRPEPIGISHVDNVHDFHYRKQLRHHVGAEV
ncbi:Uncharacterised protein [Mycobacteroides abscessus subsp. abscessus]|nr:Uncharacterised protein [Mycobacteroides abscessus subsp. abscessus]